MNFTGFSTDKKSLYSEMKIFLKWKFSSSYNSKSIVTNIISNEHEGSEEKIKLFNSELNFTNPLQFYRDTKII